MWWAKLPRVDPKLVLQSSRICRSDQFLLCQVPYFTLFLIEFLTSYAKFALKISFFEMC